MATAPSINRKTGSSPSSPRGSRPSTRSRPTPRRPPRRRPTRRSGSSIMRSPPPTADIAVIVETIATRYGYNPHKGVGGGIGGTLERTQGEDGRDRLHAPAAARARPLGQVDRHPLVPPPGSTPSRPSATPRVPANSPPCSPRRRPTTTPSRRASTGSWPRTPSRVSDLQRLKPEELNRQGAKVAKRKKRGKRGRV